MSTWNQPIGGGRYLQIFIWEDSNSMELANWDEEYRKSRKKNERAHGICTCAWYWNDKGDRIAGKKFGEIHLAYGAVGSGLVAHEIQHFINSLIGFKRWDLTIDNERIAQAAERATKNFWKEWYRRFE